MRIGCEFEGIKPQLSKFILDDSLQIENYKHNTLKVTNLHEFVEVISILTSYYSRFDWSYETDGAAAYLLNCDHQFIYRGQSNYAWDIEPSIAVSKLWGQDRNMVDTLRKMYPDDFNNNMSNFEILAKMQHFGLPTKLCDFSKNPLIALYFSCLDENHDFDGRIVMAYQDLTPRFDRIIDIICNTKNHISEHSDGLMPVADFNERYLNGLYAPNEFWEAYVEHDGLFFSVPAYMSERERRQQSVFLIFAKALFLSDNVPYDDFGYFDKRKYNFNLFTEDNFSNVRVSEGFSRIPESKLSEEFVSIIINASSKAEILENLSYMGIDRSTIYSEIEHAARKIKDSAIRTKDMNHLNNLK